MMEHNNLPDPCAPLNRQARGPIFKDFLAQATRTPDAAALASCDGECSYRELEQISRQIANSLSFHGVYENGRVLILSDRNPALVYAMLGVLRAGAAFTIADAAYPTARTLLALKLVQPALLLVCGDVPLPGGLGHTFSSPDAVKILRVPAASGAALDAFSDFNSVDLADQVDVRQIAYITFTSGSTGQPKGIVTSHAPLPHFIDWHVARHGFTRNDRFSLLSGLSHDPVFRDVFTPLSIGATLCIPRPSALSDPSELVDWLARQAVSVCHLTPALGEALSAGTENRPAGLPDLRHVFWGGDVLSQKTHARLRELAPGAAQVNFYGATETPQAVAYFPIPPDWSEAAFPIGKGIADTQLLVVTQAGHMAQVGEIGEIWVRSPYLSNGYLDDEKQTQAKFVANPFSGQKNDLCYRTGDFGRYLPDGNVVFVGRVDNQVKIRGFRVELGEVACAIERFDGVAHALVLAKDNGGEGKALTAYYSCQPGRSADPAELLDALRQTLPAYMVPAFLIPLNRFPLLPNGKIDLQALPPTWQEDTPKALPSNPREAELAGIWQEILGVERVGVNDNFLALGGDSLGALKALAKMRRLGIPTEVARGIFQGRTIHEIIGGEGGEQGETAVLTAESRTNLLINILRGLLLLVIVTEHWFQGLLNRFADRFGLLLDLAAPLFNVATPGFAFVFGASLGYLFYDRHKANPAQTRKMMWPGTGLLLAGISADAILRLGALDWDKMDSTLFFGAFYSPLLYYALALITAPLWFWIIARTRSEYRACASLMVLCYLLFQASLWWLRDSEPTGFLSLCRLMLVAKFNYFNMSFGTLGGVMAGIYLKRHYPGEISLQTGLMGFLGTALGVEILYLDTGMLNGFYDSNDMGLWRWLFYVGLVLMLAAGVLATLRHFAALPALLRKGLQIIGILGQGTLPIFVLQGLMPRVKLLLLMAGLPMWAALAIPSTLFFAFCGWMVSRLYQLYHGRVAD